MTVRWFRGPLEANPQCELDSARQIDLVGNLTEAGAQTDIWFCELGMVEDIEDLAGELQLQLICEIEVLVEGHIPVVFTLRLQLRIDALFVAEGKVCGLTETGSVEPHISLGGAMRGSGRTLVASWGIVGSDCAGAELAQAVAVGHEGDGKSAAQRSDAGEAPTADDGIGDAVDSREVFLPMTEGQINSVIDDEIVGQVLLTERFLSFQIGVVLYDANPALSVLEGTGVISVAEQFAPGVSALQDATVREVSGDRHLQRIVGRVPVARYYLAYARVLRMRLEQISFCNGGGAVGPSVDDAGERVRYLGQKCRAESVVLVGKLIEIETGACVSLRKNQVHALGAGVGNDCGCVVIQGSLHGKVPLLRVTIGLIRDSSADALTERSVESSLGPAAGPVDAIG